MQQVQQLFISYQDFFQNQMDIIQNPLHKHLFQPQSKSLPERETIYERFTPRKRKIIRKNSNSKHIKINQNWKNMPISIKKGTNTPKIHITTLCNKIKEYSSYYFHQNQNFYEKAFAMIKQVVANNTKTSNFKREDLKRLFGEQENMKENLQQFIIKRMNARVLNAIYEKDLQKIVFEEGKKQDKLMVMLFLYDYQTRLFIPELCDQLASSRPPRQKSNKVQMVQN